MLLFLSVSLFTFWVYTHLTMHFIVLDNVARCLSLVFNVIFTYIFLGRTTSLLTCSTLLVVMVGFVSGVQGEIGRPIHTYTCVHYFCLSLYSLCVPNFNMKNSSMPSYLSDDDILYVIMYVCICCKGFRCSELLLECLPRYLSLWTRSSPPRCCHWWTTTSRSCSTTTILTPATSSSPSSSSSKARWPLWIHK